MIKDKRTLSKDDLKFRLPRFFLDGFTEIVMITGEKFYVMESPDDVRNVIIHYTLKNKDFSKSWFNRVYTFDNGDKVYNHEVIVGEIDLDKIYYITTEPLCDADKLFLKEYLSLPEKLNLQKIRNNMMVNKDVLNLKSLLKDIRDSLAIKHEETYELT